MGMPKLKSIPAPEHRVSVGHNAEVQQVSLVFGDPLAPVPTYVTFSCAQARAVAKQMLRAADEAEGKKAH